MIILKREQQYLMWFATVSAVRLPYVSLKESLESAQYEDCRFGGKLSKLYIGKAQVPSSVQEPRKLWW